MSRDFEQVHAGILQYCRAVHTQNEEDFLPIMAQGIETVLISPGGYFQGNDRILKDFLQGGIRRMYTRIDLIADEIDLRQVAEDTIIAVFAYHTECIRREDGEPHGIAGLETQVWLRQTGEWKLAHVHYSVKK